MNQHPTEQRLQQLERTTRNQDRIIQELLLRIDKQRRALGRLAEHCMLEGDYEGFDYVRELLDQ